MDKLREITQLRGFWDTLKVLKDDVMTKREFYAYLRKFSYYNAFLRVRDSLIAKGIVGMCDGQIFLTFQGEAIYQHLLKADRILREGMKAVAI